MLSATPKLLINLKSIANNYNLLKQICKTSTVGASVKANCYGLGVARIVETLYLQGCRDFFVANTQEAVELKKYVPHNGVNIYILHGVFIQDLQEIYSQQFIPVLNHLQQVELWQNYGKQLGKKLPAVLHVDTALNRLGMQTDEFEIFANRQDIHSNINLLYVMSHLSSSDDAESLENQRQLELFEQSSRKLPGVARSLASSCSIFLGEKYHYDLARPGAIIYGLNPLRRSLAKNVQYHSSLQNIQHVVQLTAPIIQITRLHPGQTVGYNRTYCAKNHCKIATVAVGYGDGFFRSLSNMGCVYINGHKASIIGQVSMDLINIDVTDIPEEMLTSNAEVELIGSNNTPDDIARMAQTIGYEILTNIGNRYQKIYNSN